MWRWQKVLLWESDINKIEDIVSGENIKGKFIYSQCEKCILWSEKYWTCEAYKTSTKANIELSSYINKICLFYTVYTGWSM